MRGRTSPKIGTRVSSEQNQVENTKQLNKPCLQRLP
jgi:hypothetical protein